MKKIIAIAMLAFVSSSMAFAGTMFQADPPGASASVSESAQKSAPAQAQSAMTVGAEKVGSIVGGIFQKTASLGKAFASGVKSGYAGNVPASPAAAVMQASSSGLSMAANKAASMFKRDKSEADAPVEDRSSASISSGNRQASLN